MEKQDDTIERIEERMREGVYHSTFTFGGGFVIITFMKKKFVDELHWIDEQEMLVMSLCGVIGMCVYALTGGQL